MLSVVFARWAYAEIDQAFPEVSPVIDYALETVAIPTHDNWDLTRMEEIVRSFASRFSTSS
jgi:hypothetical protein